jgi:hypothetical protein
MKLLGWHGASARVIDAWDVQKNSCNNYRVYDLAWLFLRLISNLKGRFKIH